MQRRWRRWWSVLGLLLAPAGLMAQGGAPATRPLTVRILDVGQGDAILLTTPAGRHVLVDAGEHPTAVKRMLDTLGVRRLSLVIASHQHADHIGGMPAVLADLPIGAYRDNGSRHPTATARRVLDLIARRQIRAAAVTRRETFTLDGVTIELFPGALERREAENDKTIGVLVTYGAARAFLAGDGEGIARALWEQQGLQGPVDLLKVSHHGASNGTDLRFLRRLRPGLAAISVGRTNTYGHPHPQTLRYLAAARTAVYRTDAHGTLTFQAWPSGEWLAPDGPYRRAPAAQEAPR